MTDKPKISKHHTGQHPALQSFRAFDIIPPSKVKPAHTARPIITTELHHFDNTLAPIKHNSSASASSVISESESQQVSVSSQNPAPNMPVADLTAAIIADDPVIPQTTEQVTEATETVPSDSQVQDSSSITEASNDSEAPETAAAPDLTTDSVTEDEDQSASDDLDSILGQGADKSAQENTSSAPVNRSPEFASVLKEFSAQPDDQPSTKPVVAVHKHDYLRAIGLFLLWLVAVLALVVLMLDILLDTQTLQTTYDIPHTHIFQR